MGINLIIQYIAVGVVLIAAVVWIAVRVFNKSNRRKSSCGDCSLCTAIKDRRKPPCKSR